MLPWLFEDVRPADPQEQVALAGDQEQEAVVQVEAALVDLFTLADPLHSERRVSYILREVLELAVGLFLDLSR